MAARNCDSLIRKGTKMFGVGSVGNAFGNVGSCGAAQLGRYRGVGAGEIESARFPYREGQAGSVQKLIDPPPTAPAVPIKDGHLDIIV